MKKIIVLLIAIVLIFGLAACNITITPLSKQDPAPIPAKEEPAPTVEAEPVPKPPPAPAPLPESEPAGMLVKPGRYEVGVDFDAGEYVIVGSGSFEVNSDDAASDFGIIQNGRYQNRLIISLIDNDYFSFDSGEMYPIENAPPVDLSSGKLKDGVYLVGKDFPAGEYKLTPTVNTSSSAFMTIYTDSRPSNSQTIAVENFNTEIYQTFKDGQYVCTIGCEIIL